MALPVLPRAVSAGARHGLLVGQDGLVSGCGSTLWGELYPAGGAAGQQTVATPTALPGLGQATAVLASTGRSWALRDDGTVWHWPGVHNLGVPPYASFTLAPGQVRGITGTVRKIVRGGRSPNGGIADAFALTDDGKVWDITVTTTMAFPVTIHSAVASAAAALNGVRDPACGSNHCLALQGDGRVLAWGDNSFGQLGPAGTGNADVTPVPVTGLTAANAVPVLNAASLALLADRTVWTWGGGTQNGRGGADSAQPLALPQPQGVAELAASAGHVLLRLANGQVWGWGGNGSAELGDGSRLDRPSPVQAVGILL